MAHNDLGRNVEKQLSHLEQLKEQVSAVDQAYFDEAWDTMYETIKEYLGKLARARFDHLEAARPWYEDLAEAIFLPTGGNPPQSGEEMINFFEKVTERVRNLPNPTD